MLSHVHARAPRGRHASLHDYEPLFRRSAAGDTHARETIIVAFLPYANRLARRYVGRGEPIDDLCQVASVGLIKAVDRYDPERAASFTAFAEPTILGEIRRHFRDTASPLHVPRSVQDRAQKVARTYKELMESSGREPTMHEIAAHVHLDVAEIDEALVALKARWPASLDATRTTEDGVRVALTETVGEEDPQYERVESSLRWGSALPRLPARDRYVVLMRYGYELTQSEIGRRIGVSQMHVSRILRSATAALATVLEPQ